MANKENTRNFKIFNFNESYVAPVYKNDKKITSLLGVLRMIILLIYLTFTIIMVHLYIKLLSIKNQINFWIGF